MNQQNEALEHLVTVRDWIRFCMTRLEQSGAIFGQGTDNSWDESVFLVLRSLHLPVDELDPFLDAHVLLQERHRLYQVIERRCRDRVPAAYILGESWLAGYRFKVTEDVLIPRSPVSELLNSGLEPWIGDDRQISRIADVCTGSGCLAILAALRFPNAQVTGTDVSGKALEVARQNVIDYGLEARIDLLETDLIEDLAQDQTLDLIICNPPYINAKSMASLPPEFRKEPELALAGGKDGMDLVKKLFEQARSRLNPQGWILLEIGHEQMHFEAAFADLNPIWLQTGLADNHVMLISAGDLTT